LTRLKFKGQSEPQTGHRETAPETSAADIGLSMLWREYALADDFELTKSAQSLKRRLLETFTAGEDATEA